MSKQAPSYITFSATLNGVNCQVGIPRSEFKSVDLNHSLEIGRYEIGNSSGAVLSDGRGYALNPDSVLTRGSVVLSRTPTPLPDTGTWGVVNGAWDIVPEAKKETAKPKTETATKTETTETEVDF